MEKYIHGLGLIMEDVSIDQNGKIFILIEDNNPRAVAFYKEIELPEEYQTFENVEIMRQLTLQRHEGK